MYKNVVDYIKKNMNGLCGDFKIAVTNINEYEEGSLLLSFNADDKQDGASFLLHADGSEEYREDI